MTVKEVIAGVIGKTGLTPLPEGQTCDRLMAGNPEQEVTKVVTTFMATVDVIRQAAEIGADFIITHEPTWFTGRDDTEWVQKDPVYVEKRELIEENNIAVWRFHDHIHMCQEDGIYRGFEEEYGWGKYKMKSAVKGSLMDRLGGCYEIPRTSLKELALFFKDKSKMEVIQIVGNPDMMVERVGVLVGGGSLGLGVEEMPMQLMAESNLDLIICGDITEWTLPAYVRDASQMGMNKGILVLGHERSEEPGMKHLVSWLGSICGDTQVVFIDSGEPFLYL